jgi:DNA-binding transcriptional LysR family regulator
VRVAHGGDHNEQQSGAASSCFANQFFRQCNNQWVRAPDASTDDLQFFSVVARSASLTVAAREIGTTVSTVSKRLRRIEDRLGVRLVQRTTRRLTLTSEGERYARGATSIITELAALEDSLSEQSTLVGRIRVVSSVGLGRHHVAPLTAEFCSAHPRVRIELQLSALPLNVTDTFDVAVHVGGLHDSRMSAKRLCRNQRVICAAPAYLHRHGAPVTPVDLRDHNCIVLRQDDGDYALWRFGVDENESSIRVAGNIASTDGDVVTQWCVDGYGIIMRSLWHVAPLLASGALVRVLADVPTPSADIMAVFPVTEHMPRRVMEYIDHLAAGLDARITVPPAA